MATIEEQLTSLANTKTAIKDAIVAKGVTVADADPFSAYPAKIGQISGGGGEETQFGIGLDKFFGTVDAEGSYLFVLEDFILDLTGVKSVNDINVGSKKNLGFAYLFVNKLSCVGVIANDLVESTLRGSFSYMFQFNSQLSVFEFNSLEVIESQDMFSYCNATGSQNLVPHFNKLKSIKSHSGSFRHAFYSPVEPDETFPLLEYVSGDSQLDNFRKLAPNDVIVFSKIKTIVGGTGIYSSTFGSFYFNDTVWHFPSATEFTGYIWNVSSIYAGEIHFAAANRAAIEACEGYDYKWGFQNATIYFDLMLNITVNGIVYDREHTIGGYTSWKDTNGNLVYTDATAEPVVGTVVYSDKGTTQVGTVSEAS